VVDVDGYVNPREFNTWLEMTMQRALADLFDHEGNIRPWLKEILSGNDGDQSIVSHYFSDDRFKKALINSYLTNFIGDVMSQDQRYITADAESLTQTLDQDEDIDPEVGAKSKLNATVFGQYANPYIADICVNPDSANVHQLIAQRQVYYGIGFALFLADVLQYIKNIEAVLNNNKASQAASIILTNSLSELRAFAAFGTNILNEQQPYLVESNHTFCSFLDHLIELNDHLITALTEVSKTAALATDTIADLHYFKMQIENKITLYAKQIVLETDVVEQVPTLSSVSLKSSR
jgi:hypothetical protein